MNWAAIMRIGLGEIGLKPDILWSLCPVELWIMAGLEQSANACMRVDLEALQKQFPDK